MNKIKEKTIAFLEKHPGKSFKQKEMAKAVGVNAQEYIAYKRLLTTLSKGGEIRKLPKSRYSSKGKKELIEGIFSGTMKGFGFVIVEDDLDIFIPSENTGNALSGDKVKVRIYSKNFGPNPEGKIVEIIARKRAQIVGTLKKERGKIFVVPDERSLKTILPVLPGKDNGAKSGQLVVVKLIEAGVHDPKMSVEVIRMIGFPDEPGTDFESICATFGLSKTFPQKVEIETKNIEDGLSKNEIRTRLDLRDLLCFTIDPVEAKDFDDAVSIEILENGNQRLGVHIADVSHYVQEGTALDKEAFKRGTSVYLIDHVVPMLPEKISNDLCSLRPEEDRYAFSVLMELRSDGALINYEIKPSVIRSKRRFSYHEVQEILDKGKGDHFKELKLLNDLAKKISATRKSIGSIDFDLSESIFRLDKDGMPYDVYRSERLDSHRLIEEFMLLANKTVSTHIALHRSKEKLPFLYRVHPRPKEDDVKNFIEMLKFVGVNVKVPSPIRSEDFRDILSIVEKLPEKDLLEKIALRSMSKAVYSEKNAGHFALAFKYYSHFTSPIRRYPDLVVHRLLKRYATNIGVKNLPALTDQLKRSAHQSSDREANAVSAERAYARIKEVKFLSERIGTEFDGIISGVINAGVFVEIVDFPVEGFVPVKLFSDDYYVYERERHRLIGKRTKKSYMLGDKIRIKVKSVKVAEKEVEFSPVS